MEKLQRIPSLKPNHLPHNLHHKPPQTIINDGIVEKHLLNRIPNPNQTTNIIRNINGFADQNEIRRTDVLLLVVVDEHVGGHGGELGEDGDHAVYDEVFFVTVGVH